jgi:hypothetical protein
MGSSVVSDGRNHSYQRFGVAQLEAHVPEERNSKFVFIVENTTVSSPEPRHGSGAL